MSDDWSRHIGRSPNLEVDDRSYTWAGAEELKHRLVNPLAGTPAIASGVVRLVDVTLDTPAMLSWAVSLVNARPSAKFDPTRFAQIRVTTGVSRASLTAQADLLGSFTGQICCSSLRVEALLQPGAPGDKTITDVCQVACIVSRGAQSKAPWTSWARTRSFGDTGGETITVPATWRRGLTISNNGAATDPEIKVQIPQNLDGSGRALGSYTLNPGQTLTLADYCGPLILDAPAVGLLYAIGSLAEW